MKTSVIQIGNSKGIRIPKTVLKQCKIDNEVDLEVKDKFIVIKPLSATPPRKNWEAAFKKMNINQDDNLFIPDKIDLEMENWKW